MKENLVAVAGYPGYWIDEFGQCFSDWHRKGLGGGSIAICDPKYRHPLKAEKIRSGYLRYGLTIDGKFERFLAHRLVAEAFLPNPLGLPEVNHKDENPRNNRAENLEWCTREYNLNYGTRNERARKSLTNRSDMSKPVVAYTYASGEYYGEYPSACEAARQLGLYQSNITQCCKGKRKHAGGYAFEYIH